MKLLHFEWEVAGGAKRGEDVLDVVRNAVGDAVIVQEKEAVQQDGHVTISWYYSGHPSVRAEARAGSHWDGLSNG